MDFVSLLDTLRAKPGHCTTMEMTFAAKTTSPERIRRALLGPCTHLADASQEHPFCPC